MTACVGTAPGRRPGDAGSRRGSWRAPAPGDRGVGPSAQLTGSTPSSSARLTDSAIFAHIRVGPARAGFGQATARRRRPTRGTRLRRRCGLSGCGAARSADRAGIACRRRGKPPAPPLNRPFPPHQVDMAFPSALRGAGRSRARPLQFASRTFRTGWETTPRAPRPDRHRSRPRPSPAAAATLIAGDARLFPRRARLSRRGLEGTDVPRRQAGWAVGPSRVDRVDGSDRGERADGAPSRLH